MPILSLRPGSRIKARRWMLVLLLCATLTAFQPAHATENGASVYPVGVETVMPGVMPPPHGTMLYEYTAYVYANETVDANGNKIPVEFRLRVGAIAVKCVHNWGVPFLGGTLESNVAVPFVDQTLHVIPGNFTKFAVTNIGFSPLGVRYVKKDLHFFYEGDIWTPGTGFSSHDVLNIGQNNYAAGPVGGFTYLRSRNELSSKIQYIFNLEDSATNYQSGNEFIWEYDGMHEVTRKIALGANGFFYKQTTDDMLNNAVYLNGNRGRDFAIGPEVRFNMIHHGGFALKYLRDTSVENRAPTNAFWFQLAVPLTVGARE